MPVIIKKCFLFHYDLNINSDKVFNLFLIDNQNGTYSAISEYGRSGTNLNVKPLVENCSLAVAQSRYSAKIDEKVYHKRTPYKHTLNASSSPTFKKFGAANQSVNPIETAKIINFKSAQSGANVTPPVEKGSGEQSAAAELFERRSKRIGVLNLDKLDALEF